MELRLLRNCTPFQSQLSETDLSAAEAMSSVLKEQRELIEENKSLLMAQSNNLSEVERSMSESTDAFNKLTGRVSTLEEEVNKILAMTGEMQASTIHAVHEIVKFCFVLQTSIRNKVNASDIASLMPTSSDNSDEAASLLPKILELQTKIGGLEGEYFQ